MPASALSNSHSIHICAARFFEARKKTNESGCTYVEAVGSAGLQHDAAAAHHAVAPEDGLVHVAHRWCVEGLEALALAVPVDVGRPVHNAISLAPLEECNPDASDMS